MGAKNVDTEAVQKVCIFTMMIKLDVAQAGADVHLGYKVCNLQNTPLFECFMAHTVIIIVSFFYLVLSE
jgi:hypothetical protein